ncbi:MAG: hypothetical protein H8E20_14375 [Verrucomicrobia bacterium]|nr:hypothetical protein [Verrucomicrobiota bacterium]
MSVPPRTKVRIEVKAVHGVTVISLPRCLMLNGLILGNRPVTETKTLLGQGRSVAKRLAKAGCTLDELEKAGNAVKGVYIGIWIPNSTKGEERTNLARRRVCADLPLSLMLLSRRIGNLYLSHRPPDFSPDHLLAGEWLWDDPRVIFRANRCVPPGWKTAHRNGQANGGRK